MTDPDLLRLGDEAPIPIKEPRMKLYLAGPLFSTGERDFNYGLARLLRVGGHDIFLPQENEQRADRPDLIFKSDVDGILWADVVVACLDGSDPDSGTCWEMGYAYGIGKPVIGYRTDFRLFEGGDKVNLMMTESAQTMLYLPFATVSTVATEINKTLKAVRL